MPYAPDPTPGLQKLELCSSQLDFLPRGPLRSPGRLEETENGPKWEEAQGKVFWGPPAHPPLHGREIRASERRNQNPSRAILLPKWS